MKNIIIAALGLIIVIGGVYFVMKDSDAEYAAEQKAGEQKALTDTTEVTTDEPEADTEEDLIVEEYEAETIIGSSVGEQDITAYHYGRGETELLFIGGIHGGYAWNTVLVARELMNYLEENPEVIPEDVKVTVIPVLNPDGLVATVGTDGAFSKSDVPASQATVVAGRFNNNDVDLNRNFACDWQAEGIWQNKAVSGGDSAFSEPESQAVKSYIEKTEPSAVIAWYSAAGGVYSSSCHNGVLQETETITDVYADASGYPAYKEFDFYEVTGDMVNWVAKGGIPAISILLTTHGEVEWDKNQKGVDALLNHYAE